MLAADIISLRDKVIKSCMEQSPWDWARIQGLQARVLQQTPDVSPWQTRQGLLSRGKLEALRFDGRYGYNLTGWLTLEPKITPEESKILEQYPWPQGQTGHCQLHYADILKIGIDGVRRKISASMATADETGRIALESFAQAIDGFSAMIVNAGQAASPQLTERCAHIAQNPPRDFHEALQLIWLANIAVGMSDCAACICPGRLDRELISFYTSDVSTGRLTTADALLLLEEFYLLVNYTYPHGLAYGVMVGGKDVNGCDTTNELSYLCFEALRRTKLAYPTVGVCWNEQTPQDLLDIAVNLVSDGYSTPAFFGDDVINKGLSDIGVPAADACNYINSACVEITPCNGSNIWVASPYFSTCGILLEEIAAQVQNGNESPDFDDFLQKYLKRLDEKITAALAQENASRIHREKNGRKPLQSVFTLDCIERARDIDDGGARYNHIECSFVGLANLADSLYIIREEIFNKHTKTLAELKNLLDSNFAISQEDASRFRNAYPKYGHGCEDLDALLGRVIEFFQARCREHKIYPDNSRFLPGSFCWQMHTFLGNQCGATPDGRLAGTPFADGAGPAQGRETLGPTAAIISTTSWDHSPMLGGVAYNMKFNKSLLAAKADREKLKALIVTYLKRGGFETQINVLDSGVLEKALKNPENYGDLVVRIGGYTDYFTRLCPEMQREVMQRMEFNDV